MESREVKLLVNKSGGTAGKGSLNNRISLPTTWVREMGLSEENKEALISFDEEKIVIESKK